MKKLLLFIYIIPIVVFANQVIYEKNGEELTFDLPAVFTEINTKFIPYNIEVEKCGEVFNIKTVEQKEFNISEGYSSVMFTVMELNKYQTYRDIVLLGINNKNAGMTIISELPDNLSESFKHIEFEEVNNNNCSYNILYEIDMDSSQMNIGSFMLLGEKAVYNFMFMDLCNNYRKSQYLFNRILASVEINGKSILEGEEKTVRNHVENYKIEITDNYQLYIPREPEVDFKFKEKGTNNMITVVITDNDMIMDKHERRKLLRDYQKLMEEQYKVIMPDYEKTEDIKISDGIISIGKINKKMELMFTYNKITKDKIVFIQVSIEELKNKSKEYYIDLAENMLNSIEEL